MLPVIGYSLPARETAPLSDTGVDSAEFLLSTPADADAVSRTFDHHRVEIANFHCGPVTLATDLVQWKRETEPVERLVAHGWARTVSVTLMANSPAVDQPARFEHAATTVRDLQRHFDGSRLFVETMPQTSEPTVPVRDNEFTGDLLRRTGCGWLLNVAELFARSRNVGFDPYDTIAEIIPFATNVVIRMSAVRYEKRIGAHVATPEGVIPDDVWSLVRHALVLGCHKTRAIFIAGRHLKEMDKPRQADVRHARFIVDRVQGRQRMLRQQPV